MEAQWRKAQEEEAKDWKDKEQGSEKERWVSLLRRYPELRDGEAVLDVGSGPDGLVFYINANTKVAADPLMVSYLETIKDKRGVELISSKGEELPFKDSSFSSVFCINALDHTIDPFSILKEIRRVMKQPGRGFIHVFCYNAIEKLFFRLGYKDPNFYHHPHKLKPKDVINLVKRAGLNVTGVRIETVRPPVKHVLRQYPMFTFLRSLSYLLFRLSKRQLGLVVELRVDK
jgi:SAM-dependent methyltransferase